MAEPVETISFRSSDHEFLKSYHGDICGVLSRSEETLIMFAGMLYGKRLIDVHTKNAVIRRKGSEGADILMDKVEMKVKQNPRNLKRVLRMMKKLEDLETISRKIGSKISRSRRRSHPLLSSDRSSKEESSSVASPGEAVIIPTVAELCSELNELVEWEKTVIHFPAMSSTEVEKVKRNESRVDQQKQEAFDTWLRRYPRASWSHVRDALHNAGEYNLEKKIAKNHDLSLVFSECSSRRTQDDTANKYLRTSVQTGSFTCGYMYNFTEAIEAAKTLRKTFNNLVEFFIPMMSELDVYILKLRINTYIKDEQQNTHEIRKDLDDLRFMDTPYDILNFLINRNFLGYLNYELLEVFEGMVSSDESTSKIQEYKTYHDKFLQCTDFETLVNVFKEKPELRPASAVGLPNFTLHLESRWEGKSTYSWKKLFDKQFNWPPHVHVTRITRNCIIIEYNVLPFFASSVVRDLTDPLALAVLKRQGVTVKLSQELIEMEKEMIGPRNDKLHCAVVTGTVANVEKLIEGGVSVQEIDEEGYTPLHLAAMCGRTDIVKALIKHGANIHSKTQDRFVHAYKEGGYTSLHLAAESGKTDTVEALIKHGAKFHEKTTLRGYTSLHLAAESGKTDTMEALIKQGADVHEKTTMEKYTSLHLAAESGKTDSVEVLIKHGAKVHETTTGRGYTSLHLAAKSGKTDTVEVLIKHGAKVNEKASWRGYTSLHLAAKSGKTDTVEALIKHGVNVHEIATWEGYTSLHLAAEFDKTDTVEALIKHGACVNMESKDGITSFHCAVQGCSSDTVERLIKHHSADVLKETKDGRSVLHFAACNRSHPEVAEPLVTKYSIDVNKQDKNGWTALQLALSWNGNAKIVPVLARHGAHVQEDKDGKTILHLAAENWGSYPEVVEFLITKYSLDVNKQDKSGASPLLCLVRDGHFHHGSSEVVEKLLKFGADPNFKDEYGRTPLWYIDRWLQKKEMFSSYMDDEEVHIELYEDSRQQTEAKKIKELLLSNGAKSDEPKQTSEEYSEYSYRRLQTPYITKRISEEYSKYSYSRLQTPYVLSGDLSEPDPLSEVF